MSVEKPTPTGSAGLSPAPTAAEKPMGTFFGQRSSLLSAEIAELIPGGVDSPFRSFKEVGGHTIFFERAKGSRLYDVDGNEFIDYLGAWGPAILGHCVPEVVAACQETLAAGPVFGAPHLLEMELARAVKDAVPSCQMMRFVNSGTEAVMSAVRLARGYTKRDLIIMFEGCYHGHSDSVLASQSHCASDGIPNQSKQNTILVPYNDSSALQNCLETNKGKVAAVLIEPVAGSMGVVPPLPGYLEKVESLCLEHDVVLIFDEVLTGCRVARGGAQGLYGIKPDLTCFGKALGGGMAIGAFGGRREIMLELEPIGKVYQAGTFSGNPLTMAGGIATLKLLADKGVFDHLESLSSLLFDNLQSVIDERHLPVQLQRVGSMFAILFSPTPVTNFKESLRIDGKKFALFYHELLNRGIYLPPSSVDAASVSAAHSVLDIEQTVDACTQALSSVFA